MTIENILRTEMENDENHQENKTTFKFSQLSIIVVLLFMQFSVLAQTDRGRPHISSELGFNQLLTDNNTLLRGVSLSWDGGDNEHHENTAVVPTQAQMDDMSKVYGMNTIHVYLEMNCPYEEHSHPVGENALICDSLVNMAARADMYVIITIGCGNWNGQITSMQFAKDFWSFYAPRYADRTHVIYEVHNEPGDHTPNDWHQEDWDNQVTLFKHIRALAPNTHIMTNSFMKFSTPSGALEGIQFMKDNGVDYSNASVAFHGYEAMNSIENCITTFMYDRTNGMTPALFCSEYALGDNDKGFLNMLEKHNVGWAQFTFLNGNFRDVSTFKRQCDRNNASWEPDYGNWPVVVPVTGVALSSTSLEFPANESRPLTTTLSPSDATNQTVFYSSSNDAVASVSPIGKVKGLSEGSAIITVTTHDGNYTATCAVTIGAALPRPYLGSPVNIPGTIEAENFDNGGEGVAYHDDDVVNIQGQYRPYEGVDIEACSEGGYNLGYISNDEWLEYTVNVTAAGNYDIDLRVASDYATGVIHVEFDGVDKTGLINFPSTGGWQSWTNVSVKGVSLSAGEQIMRVYMHSGPFNFNSITITNAGPTVPVTGVSLSPANASIEVGSTQQLTATVSPSDATNPNVTYTTSNSSVATVSSTGLVTAVAEGSATITVTTQDGGYTATCDVTVIPAGGIGGDTQAPSSVGGFTASSTTTTITLNWAASSDNVGVTGYNVFLDGTYVNTTTSTSYTFTGLTSRTRYTLGVSAYDAAGNESGISTFNKRTSAKSAKVGSIIDKSSINIAVYPNPATTSINIKGNFDENSLATIINLNGKVLRKANLSNTNTRIDISEFPVGIYFIKITGLNKAETVKFIKKN